MTSDTIDRSYIRRAMRGRIALVLVLILLTGFAAFVGFSSVKNLATDLTATYTPTTGEVISEGTERVREGSRRNRHWVEHRTITVEYDAAGTAGTDDVRSDTIQVGETIDIWVQDQNGQVELEEPAGPDFWQWFWAIAVSLVTILLAWGLVVAVINSIRLQNFRPDGRQPDFVFVLQDIEAKDTGRRGNKRMLHLGGVLESNVDGKRLGERVQLAVPAKNAPQAPTYPPRIAGYRVNPRSESGLVIVHTPELQAWWVANLAFAADLAIATDGQKPTDS
jgi:hypothetical protein